MEDPLEAALTGCHVINSGSTEKEEYARLLNESLAYLPRQSHRDIFAVEEPTPKKEEECSPKVELKPLPPHLRYAFLDSSHHYPIIVNANLDGP